MTQHPFGQITDYARSVEAYHLAGSYGSYLSLLSVDRAAMLIAYYCESDYLSHASLITYLATWLELAVNPEFNNQKAA